MNPDSVPPVRPLLTHVIADEPLRREAGISGGAPAWFMPAMQVALQPLTDHVNEIARLSALVSCPFLIKLILPFIFIFFQACNRQMGNGAHLQFEVVLFPNGSDPTSAPVSHPCLLSYTLN